jgi:hypothetical protein
VDTYLGAGNLRVPGAVFIAGTTNQIVFGATNSTPSNPTNVLKWISVQVDGDTNAYRSPLYK